jgi:hypothetical protein
VAEIVRAVDVTIRAHEDVIRTTRALRELLLPQLLEGEVSPAEPRKDLDAGNA